MVSKMLGIKLKKGERVRLETPGGGGWGPATERSSVSRQTDQVLGYVTLDSTHSTKAQS